jgi:hypothetical protein
MILHVSNASWNTQHSHIVGICDLSFLITNDREGQFAARDLIDILDRSSVALDGVGVGGQTDQLDAALSELWLKLCESTELSRADWSVIFWVREENNPFVVNEFVEVDGAICGLILRLGAMEPKRRLRTERR